MRRHVWHIYSFEVQYVQKEPFRKVRCFVFRKNFYGIIAAERSLRQRHDSYRMTHYHVRMARFISQINRSDGMKLKIKNYKKLKSA